MKRILSVLLAAILLLSLFALPGLAEETLPESAHDYENNFEGSWEYTYPEDVDGIFVTFSDETYLDPGLLQPMLNGEFDEEDLKEFAETGVYETPGDVLYIYYKEGGEEYYYGAATGDMLAGGILYIPGNWFKLELVTDKSVTAYGFAVTSVGTDLPDGVAKVNYHIDGETIMNLYELGDEIELNPYYDLRQIGQKCVIGWKTADGTAYYYDQQGTVLYVDEDFGPEIEFNNGTGILAENRAVYDFYPIYTDLSMTAPDVFSFSGYDEAFYEYTRNPTLTQEHWKAILRNWALTFGLTPFMPLAADLCLRITRNWAGEDDMGYASRSCGMALAALMQHYDKIDMLSGQKAKTVSELEPTEKVQSYINYYQMQTVAYLPTCHHVIDPGAADYSAQLKALYKAVESGKPVYFEFYYNAEYNVDADHPFQVGGDNTDLINAERDTANAVLLTGAYTDEKGNHVLVFWDPDNPDYAEGSAYALCIDPDWSSIKAAMSSARDISQFSWNDDVSALDSFNPDGDSEPLAWHKAFFKNLRDLIVTFFTQIRRFFSESIGLS